MEVERTACEGLKGKGAAALGPGSLGVLRRQRRDSLEMCKTVVHKKAVTLLSPLARNGLGTTPWECCTHLKGLQSK